MALNASFGENAPQRTTVKDSAQLLADLQGEGLARPVVYRGREGRKCVMLLGD